MKISLTKATDGRYLSIIYDALSFVEPPPFVKLLQLALLQQFQHR